MTDNTRPRELLNGVDLGVGRYHASIRGPLAIIAVLFALVGGAFIYVTHQGFAENNAGHARLIAAQDRLIAAQDLTGCIVSLSASDRERLRTIESRQDFARLCLWLRGAP